MKSGGVGQFDDPINSVLKDDYDIRRAKELRVITPV